MNTNGIALSAQAGMLILGMAWYLAFKSRRAIGHPNERENVISQSYSTLVGLIECQGLASHEARPSHIVDQQESHELC